MDALYFEYARIIVGIIGFGSTVIGPSLFPFVFISTITPIIIRLPLIGQRFYRTLSPVVYSDSLGLLILPTVGWVYFPLPLVWAS